MTQFIEVCPEDIWTKKFGGWPVWQQVFSCTELPVSYTTRWRGAGARVVSARGRKFSKYSGGGSSEKDMVGYAISMKAMADTYFNALQDADLPSVTKV